MNNFEESNCLATSAKTISAARKVLQLLHLERQTSITAQMREETVL